MKKKGWDKDVVVLLVSTLITVASWVGFEVYRAYIKNEVPTEAEKHMQGIDPTLKREVFDKLKEVTYEE